MAQALVTAVAIGTLGLGATAVLGLLGTDLSRHITIGIFSTMVTLLAHSMMMFYLIGKGKAVKDAMAEGGLTGDYFRRIAIARKPVFSFGTVAMGITMLTAILGASVDTGVLPPIVHGMIACAAITANLAAAKIELDALGESSRVVGEVNRLLGSRAPSSSCPISRRITAAFDRSVSIASFSRTTSRPRSSASIELPLKR